MIADILVYFGCVVLVLGASFSLVAALGVWRLPDLYTRMHAASKAGAVARLPSAVVVTVNAHPLVA